ncbi:MAG: hypothetical protein ACR2F6_16355 [Mycobacteriales bacterium]
MSSYGAPPGWDDSALPRRLVASLDVPKDLETLTDELGVTDARVLWYLERLRGVGRVTVSDAHWSRTREGEAYRAARAAETSDCTIIPGATVYDFRQAYADTAAGMFGGDFVQAAGEHGARISAARVAEFRDRLTTLVVEYFGPENVEPAETKYGFHWVLTPTDLHPLDDD